VLVSKLFLPSPSNHLRLTSISRRGDGGAYIAGTNCSGDFLWACRVDQAGSVVWQRAFNLQPTYDFGYPHVYASTTLEGGVVVATIVRGAPPVESRVLVSRLDSAGVPLWTNAYLHPGAIIETVKSIEAVGSGRFRCVGRLRFSGGTDSGLVMNIEPDGALTTLDGATVAIPVALPLLSVSFGTTEHVVVEAPLPLNQEGWGATVQPTLASVQRL